MRVPYVFFEDPKYPIKRITEPKSSREGSIGSDELVNSAFCALKRRILAHDLTSMQLFDSKIIERYTDHVCPSSSEFIS